MKKIFSTVAMAIVAVASVVSMTSCNNDDTSSFNNSPVVPSTTNNSSYSNSNSGTGKTEKKDNAFSVGALVTDDVLALYDVQLTVNTGKETKTFNTADFSTSANIVIKALDQKAEFPAKGIGTYTYSAEDGKNLKVVAKLTLKSNFQETLDAMGDKDCKIYVQPQIKTANCNFDQAFGSTFKASKLTKEKLEQYGESLGGMLSY